MKKVVLLLTGTAIFIIGIGLLTQKTPSPEKKEVKIGNLTLLVEIADSEEKRARGLSGKRKLAEDGGMLFVFEKENVFPSFWMKGMLIPIDIIWIDEWEVVKIHENVQPEPEKSASELIKYYPDGPVDFVIEVNAGFSGKNNIRVGDKVIIEW